MDYTPEQMLDLARAAMPDDTFSLSNEIRPWLSNEKGAYRIKIVGMIHSGLFERRNEYFDPLGNPAHAWAVEQWLFNNARVSKSGNDYYLVDMDKTGWGDEEYWPAFNDNLAAAVAVMERMKGEGK